MRRQGRGLRAPKLCCSPRVRVSTVVRRWLCSYSSRALVVPCVGLLAVLRLLLFRPVVGSLRLVLSFLWAGLLRRTRLVAPRVSAELVLVVLVLAAEERFLLPC